MDLGERGLEIFNKQKKDNHLWDKWNELLEEKWKEEI
jgi:hypothetical protein